MTIILMADHYIIKRLITSGSGKREKGGKGGKGVSDPGFLEKISAIPSVPIVQNNAFPTSRLK